MGLVFDSIRLSQLDFHAMVGSAVKNYTDRYLLVFPGSSNVLGNAVVSSETHSAPLIDDICIYFILSPSEVANWSIIDQLAT